MALRLLIVLLAAASVLAACGGEPDPIPSPLGEQTLSALAARDRDLPTAALAADAFDPAALAELLERTRYRDGRERELTGRGATFDHVVARLLRFRDDAGADAYLDWVAAHTGDLVGPTRPGEPFPVGEHALLVALEPCYSCKKQLPTLLAAWRRGSVVGSVLASGRGAARATVAPLVEEVDAAADLLAAGKVR